ncbi:MAG: hypothetical protein ABSG91_15250 [Syntrophobacteraceae bacterium]|jgi:hypothetical protein
MSEDAKPYNAADPEQVKGRKDRQKIREHQTRAALQKLMADPEGRMWMWDLLSLCGVYHSSFSREGLLMAFAEGRRDIGLHLVAQIHKLAPELYVRMTTENQAKEKDA